MLFTKEQLSIIFSEDNKIVVNSLAGTGKTTVLSEYAKENIDKNILYLVFGKDMKKHTRAVMPCNTDVYTFNSFAYKLMGKNIKIIDLSIESIIELLNLESNEDNLLKVSSLIEEYKPQDNNIIYEMMKQKNIFDHKSLLKLMIDNYDLSSLNYDVLLIDEAQDVDPEMLLLIQKLNIEKVIIVGDKNQSIFSFRGNVSIIDNFENFKEYSLTKTFRFGENILNYVNETYLKINKTDLNMTTGCDFKSELCTLDTNYVGIFRTNERLLEEAFKLSKYKKIAIPVDFEQIKEYIFSILYLKIGLRKNITLNEIRRFSSFEQMEKLVKRGVLKETYSLVKLVKKYNILLFDMMRELEKSLVNPRAAEILLITAHKAKGLEFDSVKIYNDFKIHNQEERNILYVAITRAINKLDIQLLDIGQNGTKN